MSRSSSALPKKDAKQETRAELMWLQERRVSKAQEYQLAKSDGAHESFLDHLQIAIAVLDRRIAQLRSAIVRHPMDTDVEQEPGTIGLGSRVRVCWEDGAEETYVIVGPWESDFRVGRVSYESPVGQALLGRRPGESVDVNTPAGGHRLHILEAA